TKNSTQPPSPSAKPNPTAPSNTSQAPPKQNAAQPLLIPTTQAPDSSASFRTITVTADSDANPAPKRDTPSTPPPPPEPTVTSTSVSPPPVSSPPASPPATPSHRRTQAHDLQGAHEAVMEASGQLASAIVAPPEGWRCSQAQMDELQDPERAAQLKAESDLLAQWHWKTIGALTPMMRTSNQTWPEMRWIYRQDGICEPELFVLAGIVPHRFLKYRVYVHATMARKLEKAEALLKRKKFKPRFRNMVGFTPRTVRGPGVTRGRISHHAYGMAIDVEPMTNPYFSRRELKLIEEISRVKLELGRDKSAALRWKLFDRASKRYKKRVGRWIRKEKAQVRRYERLARKGRKGAKRKLREHKKRLKLVTRGHHLTQARKTGLTTLPKTFVVCMEKAGLSWGTYFPTGADMMHFSTRGRP
ncbi:MAG: M15 family metallopeptidase, partial [Myxococcota bacterium]